MATGLAPPLRDPKIQILYKIGSPPIPRKPHRPTAAEPGPCRERMPTRILVVDDIESNLFALSALLEGPSVEIIRARSGSEAIRALREDEFSLILLDVQMPEMDGFDTAAAIRRGEKSRRTPIIFVTAFGASQEKLAKAYAIGASDFMTKPIDPDALKAKVGVIADLWRMIDEAKQDAAIRHERRLAEERQRWETESLRQKVAEQEKATSAAEAARLEAENASKLKDEFLATLSHELRTPLNAILGWAALLQARSAAEPYFKRGLEVIERNAKAQTKLIEDMLDTSRIVAGKLRLERQPVLLSEIVDRTIEAMRPAAEQKKLTLEVALDRDTPPISGDPERLRQVLTNLLSNAIKFTLDGGRVDVRLADEGSRARITVRDTGVGIAREFLPYVFDRFRQSDGGASRAHGGLGIGLALARHLVELHQGAIEARSDGPGKGSTFTIVLPIDDNKLDHPTLAETSSPTTQTASLLNARVLIVDDEPDARDVLGDLCASSGAEVLTVGSAAEALAALSWRPDVIVSDIGMPGQDGYALMRQIRSLPPESGGWVPAVALTAYASLDDVAQARAAGFHAHIAKPVEPTLLLSTVAAAVAMLKRQ
jgi:signal transduction histidine kinase